jgi:hypothetical protein
VSTNSFLVSFIKDRFTRLIRDHFSISQTTARAVSYHHTTKMNLITTALFALAIASTAATSSTTPRVRAIKGVESSRNLQQYGGGYNGGGYNGGSSSGGSGSSHHKTKPKSKQKTTPKPKSHPKRNGGYSSQSYYGYSRSSAYAYSAVGMLGIVAAAIMAKKKCNSASAASSQEGGPDASDILEGDHDTTDSTITSIIGMTDDAKQEGKAVYVERLKYVPSGIETLPPPAAVAAPAETDDNVTDGSAIV